MSPNTRNTVEITTAEDFAKAMEAEHAEKQKCWQARRDIEHAKITDHERRVCDRLAVAWNEYNALQPRENEDKAEFRQCINRAAAIIAVRVARRVNPECWTPDAASKSQSQADAPACSLLEWTPNPENQREILGRSKRAPGITLYIIKLMDSRDDRGQMHGAFMSDELEREGLYDKALVHWLKWEAESQMREFLKSHTANANCAATGSERNDHE